MTVSQVAGRAPTGVVKMSEEEAKRAWLDRLDVPSWGRAAESLTNVVAEAAALQAMEADCQNQIDTACDQLSFEDAARRAWLSKLDVPTWGATAAAVTQVAAGMAPSAPAQPVSEEEAKAAWLAKLDTPVWGKASETLNVVAAEAAMVRQLQDDCYAGYEEACDTLNMEESAKKAWLAKLDAPAWGAAAAAVNDIANDLLLNLSEAEAKAAWLAKLDAATWGNAAAALSSVVAEASQLNRLAAECEAGDDEACIDLETEETAKRAWLSKLDVPAWGAAAAAVTSVASGVKTSEDEAKKAWLAKLDTPVWKTATTAMQDVAAQANQIAQMEEDCMAGRDTACDNLSKEEEAKRTWLKKLDHVEWNNAAQAVAQVASFPDSLSEQDAKAAWLAKLDAPTWGAAAAALTSAVSEAASIRKLEADCAAKVDVACDSLFQEDEAKRAWLSKMDACGQRRRRHRHRSRCQGASPRPSRPPASSTSGRASKREAQPLTPSQILLARQPCGRFAANAHVVRTARDGIAPHDSHVEPVLEYMMSTGSGGARLGAQPDDEIRRG